MTADFPVGEMPESLRLEVIRALATHEAARIAAATARIRRAGSLGGERVALDDGTSGGEVTMVIDPTSYHYWGQRLGYECWSDAQFCREYLRDNPYARTKTVGKKLKVGWRAGLGDSAFTRRYRAMRPREEGVVAVTH